MSKKKRSKLTVKLLLGMFIVLVTVILLINLLGLLVFNGLNSERGIITVYISTAASMIVWIAAFVVLLHYMVLNRVFALNRAVEKVAQGDYSVHVPEKGNDEISALTENFNKMTRELQLNLMLSKEFASYVSHEFKTPLSVIRSYAEALPEADDEERRAYTEVIIGEADSLAELSKNIITLCRIDSTGKVEKDDVFSPSEQIRKYILSMQKLWNGKKLSVELDLDEFQITSNEYLCGHIWQNLIGNAFKFTAEMGEVVVSLKKQGDVLSFSVVDNGTGIGEEDMDKIFNLFYTGDKSRSREGSGIGLYLTKTIVQKLGGNISVSSERGKGSHFTVTLPL